ncbi:MAG: hypothetical protein M3O87_03415, partial [Candidatus Dormibacteraeota bacterium]|nr:hypothetical protein [Candidatus Dormibacteraeota bacterium]
MTAVEVAGVSAARKAGGDRDVAAVAEASRPVEVAAQATEASTPFSARLNRLDLKLLVGLVVVAFLLRILSPIFPDFVTNPTSWPPVRAWGLGHPFQAPNGYIFDEVYFAQDACKDLVGKDYYDPEPPLAKLFIAGGMVLGGTWMHYDKGYHHEVTVDSNGQQQD